MTHPRIDLRHADCLELLATLPDDSIDLIATDPPYYRLTSSPAWFAAARARLRQS
ncbi:hypothetical protein ACWJKU_11085 [Methylocaldum sp. MU1018]